MFLMKQENSSRALLPPPEKAISFFNVDKTSIIKYAGRILEPPVSLPIQIVDTKDGMMNTSIVSASEKKYTGRLRTSQRESAQAYVHALSKSRTFVIADSFFFGESVLENPVGFLEYGLDPIREFFENGGRVIVICKEGFFGIGDILEPIFDCQWRLGKVGSETCVPSEKGKEIVGPGENNLYAGKGHFMIAPEDERLYKIKSITFEEYKTEYLGFSSDEDFDEDDYKEARESYEQYLKGNNVNALLVMHKHESGGSVVWMGDRNEEDPKLRPIFTKICCHD